MNYAIILSGGVGSRLGLDLPKQYYKVNEKPIIQYGLETIIKNDFIDGYVIVAANAWQDELLSIISDIKNKDVAGGKKFLGFAKPGDNRQLSIYQGLLALLGKALDNDLVLVQDAARPNTSDELISKCLSLADEEDGAMPVLRMKDTVYLSRNGRNIDELLNRAEIFAGQAPESFRFGKYLEANEQLLPDEIYIINGSTEPAVKAGMKITLIDGEESNFKITTAEDLKRFEQIVKENMK